ncbi:MAG: pyrroline-5-carboxylate reductase [Nitrospirae bacterium]|nr:pyrroline-5-carboxylate reductase [Nitrospirota bacterium]
MAVLRTLACVGAGQMAEALLAGILGSHAFSPEALRATDISAERRDIIKQRFGIPVGSDNREAVAWADVTLLAVKPQSLGAVMESIAPVLAGKLVISILAGISIRKIGASAPDGTRIVRVMPNMPALVREGVSALAIGPGATEEDRRLTQILFDAVGRTVTVEERLMDAVTGLSGSGPAYAFLAIEAMADGGVKMGLPRGIAEVLAAQTVLGAAQMVLQSGEHPARLKDRVASPGGTTIAGLHCLERGRVRATLMAAVEAATKRSRELGG